MSVIASRVYHYGPKNPFPGSSFRDPERLVTDNELKGIYDKIRLAPIAHRVAELAFIKATGGRSESVDLHEERMSLMAGHGSPSLSCRLKFQKLQDQFIDSYTLILTANTLLLASGENWSEGFPRLTEVSGLLDTISTQFDINAATQGTGI